MKKHTKLIFVLISLVLFIGTVVFTNDWVRDHTSDKIAPVLASGMFVLMLFSLLITKTKD